VNSHKQQKRCQETIGQLLEVNDPELYADVWKRMRDLPELFEALSEDDRRSLEFATLEELVKAVNLQCKIAIGVAHDPRLRAREEQAVINLIDNQRRQVDEALDAAQERRRNEETERIDTGQSRRDQKNAGEGHRTNMAGRRHGGSGARSLQKF